VDYIIILALERVSDCYLTPSEQYLSYIMVRTSYILMEWGGLWCLMPLSTIFHQYHGSQFYWWRKPEYPEKTTNPVVSH